MGQWSDIPAPRSFDRLYTDPRLVAVYGALNAGRLDHDFYTQLCAPAPADIVDIGRGTGVFACPTELRPKELVD